MGQKKDKKQSDAKQMQTVSKKGIMKLPFFS